MRNNLRPLSIWLAMIFLPTGVFSQATFDMRNRNTSVGLDAPVFDAQGIPLSGANYLAELWGGAAEDSLSPAMDYYYGGGRLIVPFINSGYFSTFHVPSIPGVPGGGNAWLQVRAWDARLGATYEEVLAQNIGGYGQSAIFNAPGGNPDPNPTLPASLIGLQSFSLLPVIPEPSGAALLLFGALALVAFCRWSGK